MFEVGDEAASAGFVGPDQVPSYFSDTSPRITPGMSAAVKRTRAGRCPGRRTLTDLSDLASFATIGMTVTGLPALNSIRSVVAAPPGIRASADLPLRGFASRFKNNYPVP